jgi:Type II secretion system (T2SS), protein M subtype b
MIRKWQDAPWIRRATFIGLNLAACIAVFFLMVDPIRAVFAEQDAKIATLSETLARMNAIANRKSDVEALTRQVDAEGDLGEFLAGANEGVVNAALQARLKTMTEGAGARVRSVQGLQPKNNGQIRYIGAKVDLYGALGAIQKVIYAIESGKPYLFVSNASIRLSQSIAAQAATTEPVIDAQLDVFGAVQMESSGR